MLIVQKNGRLPNSRETLFLSLERERNRFEVGITIKKKLSSFGNKHKNNFDRLDWIFSRKIPHAMNFLIREIFRRLDKKIEGCQK